MLWVLVGITGVAFGFVFRVPAVLAVGVGLFAVSWVTRLLQGWEWGEAALSSLCLLVTLECAYVAGLFLASLWSRTRTPKAPTGRM